MKYLNKFLARAQDGELKEAGARAEVPPVLCECYPRDHYNPAAAKRHALSDKTLTPEQRANLLRYALAAEVQANKG